jgi:hypothetical protein
MAEWMLVVLDDEDVVIEMEDEFVEFVEQLFM